ncbi:phosphatidate cytidylyltransferase [Methylophaga lonarensis MPL]|uniref:Phosphatidate cytidylyltransferase n=1 Tax=Methylophaga lonarensis MPL TaxID=1286106 RepID=M7NZ68_9GAMM|nr:phosphatidate cytidylyltransferase [Methylophaga lonarensis]EMR14128.1 phosphatidate cytidylyltransferase [Methylophaga lonarensis MPL]
MLKQRLLTAAVLIPLVVLAILKLPTIALMALLAVIVMLTAWEWLQIVGFQSVFAKVLAMVVWLIIAAFQSSLFFPIEPGLIAGGVLWLALTLLVVLCAHKPLPKLGQQLFASRWFGLVMAWLVLAVFFYSAVWLHGRHGGEWLLLHVLVLVWLADTGGYFAGKRWGKRKLATHISPNKTWEGVAGALVLVSLWSFAAWQFGLNDGISLLHWWLLAVMTALFSIAGDLFESLFKRAHAIKDSGQLLPGHGGLWDRLDSLLAAVPVFAAMLVLLGL